MFTRGRVSGGDFTPCLSCKTSSCWMHINCIEKYHKRSQGFQPMARSSLKHVHVKVGLTVNSSEICIYLSSCPPVILNLASFSKYHVTLWRNTICFCVLVLQIYFQALTCISGRCEEWYVHGSSTSPVSWPYPDPLWFWRLSWSLTGAVQYSCKVITIKLQ